MGNAESNMLKGFIQVYLFATTKKVICDYPLLIYQST